MAPLALLLAIPLVLPACATLTLPADNTMDRFRHDPELFATAWPRPVNLNGKNTRLDMWPHSENATAKLAWSDYFYPVSAELDFDGSSSTSFARAWWWVSYVAATCYLVGLFLGTSSMKDMQPYDLKGPLAMWNLFLAVFSFVGTVRTLPHLVMMLREFGFAYTVCRAARASYGSGATGVWATLFIYSKYAELVDTVFLVARKRKVGFLHWYHHCSVLLYCWHAYVWEMPTGIYFIAMNYAVHTIMYFYYFLAAVCQRPPKWGFLVTLLQLIQMAIGIAITLSHLHILISETVPHCDGHIPNLTAALGMYASYFILFAQFLFNRYCTRRDHSKAGSKPLMPKKID